MASRCSVPAGTTVLEAATFGQHPDSHPVLLEGRQRRSAPAVCAWWSTGSPRSCRRLCTCPCRDGMVGQDQHPRASARPARSTLELLLSNHDTQLPDLRPQPQLRTADAGCKELGVADDYASRARRPSCRWTIFSFHCARTTTNAFCAAAASPPATMCRRSASSAPSIAASTPIIEPAFD